MQQFVVKYVDGLNRRYLLFIFWGGIFHVACANITVDQRMNQSCDVSHAENDC